jgi:hypothetical protein
MKYKIIFLFLLISLCSCKDDNQKDSRKRKDAKKRKSFFSNIKGGFFMTPYKYHCRRKCCHWNELRLFWLNSLKTKRTIRAFQQKQQLSLKAMALNENLPIQFDKPQIKSRISTLITKVRLLDLYIHLDAISDKRWFI